MGSEMCIRDRYRLASPASSVHEPLPMFSVIIVIIIIIIIVIIISIVIIIITGKKELACYFNSYLFHSVVPDIQEHYFEAT